MSERSVVCALLETDGSVFRVLTVNVAHNQQREHGEEMIAFKGIEITNGPCGK